MGRGPKKQQFAIDAAPGVRGQASSAAASEPLLAPPEDVLETPLAETPPVYQEEALQPGVAAQTAEELRQEALRAGHTDEAYRHQHEMQKGLFGKMSKPISRATGMAPLEARDVLKNAGLITFGLATMTPLGPLAFVAGATYLGIKCFKAWRKNKKGQDLYPENPESFDEGERPPLLEALRETFAGRPRGGSISKTLGATALGSAAVGGALSLATGGAFVPFAAAVAGVSLASRAFSAWQHAKGRESSRQELRAARMETEQMREYVEACRAMHTLQNEEDLSEPFPTEYDQDYPTEYDQDYPTEYDQDYPTEYDPSPESEPPSQEGHSHSDGSSSSAQHPSNTSPENSQDPLEEVSSAEEAPIESSSSENSAPAPQSSRRKKREKEVKTRCQGTTNAGSQCKRGALSGEEYCKMHITKKSPQKEAALPEKTSRKKKPSQVRDVPRGDFSSANIARLQPQAKYNRDSYLEEQRALRDGDQPARKVFIAGFENNEDFGWGGDSAHLAQPDAMLSGTMGWDWNKTGGKVEPGDRVFVRRAETPGEIAGYFDVAEAVVVNLPSLEEASADSPAFRAVVDDIWNKISPDMDQDYYPYERFVEYLRLSCASGKESKVYFNKISNPQKLSGYARKDLAVSMKGVKNGTAMQMGTAQMNGNSTSQQRNANRSEDLMRVAEENDARLIEENDGAYPG